MLKPIRWKTFPRDFAVIQIGFALFGLSIALMIRSHLGTSPWAVLEVALSQLTSITPGRMSILVGFTVLIGALAMREQVGWGTLTNILFIGLWEDMFLGLIPSIENVILRWTLLFVAIFMMGIATAIYIGVDAGAGPRDSLMLAIKRTTPLTLQAARGWLELTVVVVGGLLGGPASIGTLLFAILIGPAVQWSFKVFKVVPHK